MKRYMGFVFMYFLILGVSAQVRVEYLKEIARFNNVTFRDYYFCCNVIDGPNLQWVVNGFGVGGFRVDIDKYAFVGSRTNFDYVVTLLSLRSNATEHYRFDSVLIVSPRDDSTLNVSCFSDVGSASTSNRIQPEDGTLPVDSDVDSDATIVLMTRALRRVIIPGQANTSIFICGAEHQDQVWQASGTNYGFDVTTKIGTEFSIPTDDQDRAKLRFVFMAREPRRLVSVLFLTEPSNVSVTCRAGNQTAVMFSAPSYKVVSGTESSSISSPENIVTSGSQTEGLNKTSPSQLSEKVSAALPLQVNAMRIAVATVFSAMWGFVL